MDKHNFSGFIWSPGTPFKMNILEKINKKNPVLHIYDYYFKEQKKFEESILEIYTTGDISQDKIKNINLKNMVSHSFSFTYFKFYIAEPNTVEKIESDIMETYKKKMSNYIHGDIIYISNNLEQTKQIEIIMNKYDNFKIIQFVNTKYLLKLNIDRADILVRKYTLENYLKDKNYKFSFYNLMQSKRLSFDSSYCEKQFKTLINNVVSNGFDFKSEIKCNKDYFLHDGSHRIAICYFLNIPFIPIKLSTSRYKKIYNIDWFLNNNFSIEHINIIQNEYIKLKSYLTDIE